MHHLSTTQATEISFHLESLGWKAFQDLCVTIVSEVFGCSVNHFLPSHDGGRDGGFRAEKAGVRDIVESYTVQCKFSSSPGTLDVGELKDELAKAQRLASRGLADNYLLMTNKGVTGVSEEKIRQAFCEIEGIRSFELYGRSWITSQIRDSAKLRMLVPRVYGLGDLSQILDERAYAQASEVLSWFGDDLAKLVTTEAHQKAAKGLNEHGFVLLLGEPAAGKSTIAASLAIGALDRWGCSTLKIRNPDELALHLNPHEKQFFWVDDAFGATQYQRHLADQWNLIFPNMAAAIRRGTRVLFTSRDYIFRAAKNDLKMSAFPLLGNSQVVIDVHDLSRVERNQILYNHVKLGDQPPSFKLKIKPHLAFVSSSSRFLPEIARRLGSRQFTNGLSLDRQSIRKFVEEPVGFLRDVLLNLDRRNFGALALIFIRGGRVESPVQLREDDIRTLELLGVAPADARSALASLNGSLTIYVRSPDGGEWAFKHPTIADAFAGLIADDPELLDIYLSGTDIAKLALEVTCGDVGIEGVKVLVPKSRYTAFAARLGELAPDALLRFLALRCDREFLELFLKGRWDIFDALERPKSYLHAQREVLLLSRLHLFGLLPETTRAHFVRRASALTITTPDLDVLTFPWIRRIFSEGELQDLRARIKSTLLPRLSSIVQNFPSESVSESSNPDEEMSPILEVIEILENEFEFDEDAQGLLSAARCEYEAILDSLWEAYSHEEDDDFDSDREFFRESITARDVFDDVDK